MTLSLSDLIEEGAEERRGVAIGDHAQREVGKEENLPHEPALGRAARARLRVIGGRTCKGARGRSMSAPVPKARSTANCAAPGVEVN